jgi:aminoglycoside phosphotransferase family enzyme/predicted kinase
MEINETPVVTVMKDILRPDKILETHISYVFIKDDLVYKVKKSVDFGFLDFSSKKKRKIMCLLEKELNGRFSEGIYLDVHKIARREKSFELVNFDSSLLTLDYCVKMKRIDDDSFLSTKVAKGEVTPEDAVKIGENIAKLFKEIKTDQFSAEENGSFEVVKFNCQENFDQTAGFTNEFIDGASFDFIKKQTMKFLEENSELFDSRVKDGFVIDGHGDLRLEHVYMNGDDFGLIDCIEFNRRFRYNDVISEIGFLAMEVDQLGNTEFADGLLEGFFKIYDDADSKKLLNFYRCYRAYVRAKVTCFLLSEKDESWEFYHEKVEEVNSHIRAAVIYAMNMFETKSLIFHGLMASGKSKNARAFAEKYPVENLNTDTIRKLMNGVDPEANVHVDFGADLYSAEKSKELYEYIGEVAERNKAVGRMSLIDGSFSKLSYLDDVRKEYSGDFNKVRFFAPEDEIMRRLEKRSEKVLASDGRPEIYESQKKSAEDIGYDLEIETTGSVESNTEKIIGFLIDEK